MLTALREHANCNKTCPRRAVGHGTRPLLGADGAE